MNRLKDIEPCNANCSFCFLKYTDILSENYIFKGMDLVDIGNIVRDIPHRVKTFGKGELIASEGDTLDNMIIVLQGSVVGEMMDFEGRILRVEQLTAPETVATAFLFGSNNVLPVNVTATEDTRLLYIPVSALTALFVKNSIVMHNFLDIMANRAQFLSKQMRLLGLTTIKGKISHYLLDLSKNVDNVKLTLQHSQSELAEMFGVARPSIGRTLREMHNEGLIIAKGKSVEIMNKKALSALLK